MTFLLQLASVTSAFANVNVRNRSLHKQHQTKLNKSCSDCECESGCDDLAVMMITNCLIEWVTPLTFYVFHVPIRIIGRQFSAKIMIFDSFFC